MGYFWVSLYLSLRGGKERVSLEDCLLRALGSALNRVPLHCGNQRTLPGVVARVEKLEQIRDVAISDAPRSVLPGNACLLAARALGDWLIGHDLSLLIGSNRVDMCVCVSRDVGTPTIAEVSVDVRVDVRVHVNRVRHLDRCLGGTNLLEVTIVNFTQKIFIVFCLLFLYFVMGLYLFTRYPHCQGRRRCCEGASAAFAQGWVAA